MWYAFLMHGQTIFTILNGELTHVHTFKLGMGYTAKGGVVFYNERIDGTLSSLRHIKRLVDGALVGFEYARIDNTDGTTAGYYKAENGVRTDITETEFRSYVDRYSYYWEYASRHVRIVGLRYNPALPESSLATSIASFATYNQIIKTFGLMYTEVAYNPVKKTSIFEKTKWTGGNYDNKMYFNTDEDFYLYNKILAACVLTQKPTAASTFGYAKKDLNGDGVEELILLEGEYHVLAIFTEVNGSAVFLDSYDDTRSAWIDASGKIHVKERPLAGLSQDAKYFVYEVEGGKLVTKLAIGVAHENVNGVQTACRWYTLDGSTETEIANSDWEVLFDEWCGDIGSSAFNTYTAEKSGLVFVKAY